MASSSSQRRCVFVGNIPYDATEEQLVQICEEVGPVVSFRLVLDRETGKPKGYGFCEYKDEETALSARRNLQGYEINGRQLRVDFAENDKTADRSREQGRGGPGLPSSSGAPSILGDSSLHQPIGLQPAASAAATMSKALGEASMTPGVDPLTHFLSKMSRHQLSQVMVEMKSLATQNGPLARQLLESSLQLSRALFQAQIILNMVSPKMLQMPNLRQPPPEAPKPIGPPFHGQTHPKASTQMGILAKLPEGQPSGQAFSQTVGGLVVPPLTSGLTGRGLLQQDKPTAAAPVGAHPNVMIQRPHPGRHPPSQRIMPAEYGGYSTLEMDSAWGPQPGIVQEGDHISKRPRLETLSALPQIGSTTAYRTSANTSHAIGADVPPPLPGKQAPQLPQEMQKALLEQVKTLTSEQLSLLPPDQRQQVMDLQQRLRMLDGLDAAM